MMADQRVHPITELNGQRVVMVEDYKASTAKNLMTGEEETLHLPKSDVLIYYTEDGSKIAARPSGTEPKIKFYVSVKTEIGSAAEFESAEAELDAKIQNILRDLNV